LNISGSGHCRIAEPFIKSGWNGSFKR